MPAVLETPQGRRLAYHRTEGAGPTVVFLGGLRSDMGGAKALHLDAWARAAGHAFVRFDYSGHGRSAGAFTDGCIGDWAQDTAAVLDRLTAGPVVLVGSSMGGWQALLAARARPDRVAGLVTVAAAPDFTEDSIWAGLGDAQRAEISAQGRVALPSAQGDPLVVTRRLIEDGRRHLVLRAPLRLGCPVRLLHGTDDAEVAMATALRLLAHAEGPDIRLTLVKGGDHRMSSPDALALLVAAVAEVLARAAAGGAR
jgi:pimeloyl-ACP methyl ester carboxylesterase